MLKGPDKDVACKICPGKLFNTRTAFMAHLRSFHSSIEGGSYTCRYGDNQICNACPAVGISHTDYVSHINRHHMQTGGRASEDKQHPNQAGGMQQAWTVKSSTVNLPAVLNDPGKGKQKDFFTRSWGVDFVDTSLLPSSPHVCELPPNAFNTYLRRIRKYYSRHSKPGIVQQPHSGSSVSPNSRGTTPSPGSSRQSSPGLPSDVPSQKPVRQAVPKLDIPSVFLDHNFDLSNPTTFNTVFPFLQDTLSDNSRLNPFQLDYGQVRQVEKSGKLAQEKLSHQLDQVEVSIAHQVAAKSHHFFQVMTYHDALMSQLIALITVVRTLRERLADVEKGVVLALKVPQLCLRKQNLELVLESLNTVHTLHQTQPTIQVLLSRQEFAGALDLVVTSQDILQDGVKEVLALKHLPGQLSQLMESIGKMLMSDFKSLVSSELSRETVAVRATSLHSLPSATSINGTSGSINTNTSVIVTTTSQNGGGHNADVDSGDSIEKRYELAEDNIDCLVDECLLSSIVSGLVRQQCYSFLEYFEDYGVTCVKQVIKDVVLGRLELTEAGTLTSLVAEFAIVATPQGWTSLLDELVGSLIVALRRMDVIYKTIISSLDIKCEDNSSVSDNCDTVDLDLVKETDAPLLKIKLNAGEVMLNICDQVHERLGKLVTVRSKPGAVHLVTTEELADVQNLIHLLSTVTENICGKASSGLQLSHQWQTIHFIQQFHETSRSQVASMLEGEKWRKSACSKSTLDQLAPPLDTLVRPWLGDSSAGGKSGGVGPATGATTGETNDPMVKELRIAGSDEPFTFVESLISFITILSSYCSLLRDLPSSACVEVAIKVAEVLKLFNSRTCQLVLGTGAVSLAGLKTITIRNLSITLRSLAVVSNLIPSLRSYIMDSFPNLSEKQSISIGRNFDHAEKDYKEHLGEVERKILQIVDVTIQQQLNSWEKKPPVPSSCFKAIGKQLLKFHEAIQDILPPSQVSFLFHGIHNQFLKRVAEKLKLAKLRPDNSPTHGLVVSELIFYRENLKYMNVLSPEDLIDSHLQTVWTL